MKLSVQSFLAYETATPCTLLMSLRASRQSSQTILHENLNISPTFPHETFAEVHDGPRFDRFIVDACGPLTVKYEADVEIEPHFFDPTTLLDVSPHQFKPTAIPYLFPSRYCPSDELGRFAHQKFGSISTPYVQVCQVSEWISNNIEYLPGVSHSNTTALDTLIQSAGVCRDFSHLMISICRALNLPARYVSAYAWMLKPPDFHAMVEVLFGDRWFIFDPTQLAAMNGLVKIGVGRDAADLSINTSFGLITSTYQEVSCEMLTENVLPMHALDIQHQAVSLDPALNSFPLPPSP